MGLNRAQKGALCSLWGGPPCGTCIRIKNSIAKEREAHRAPSSDGIHNRLRRGRAPVCGSSLSVGGQSIDSDTFGGALRLICYENVVLGSH